MQKLVSQTRAWWLVGLGSLVGWAAGIFWPQSPLHAVATDRQENFAIATGSVDGGLEAVYTLDFLTGDLRGAVVSPVAPRSFAALYNRNIMQDLGLEAGTSPKFLMVTGGATLRPAGQMQFGGSIIYVAELNTGNLAMYAIAFNPAWITRPSMQGAQDFVLLNVGPIRNASIRK